MRRLGPPSRPRPNPPHHNRIRPRVEQLESRNLLSIYTPAQIRTAYGFNAPTVSALTGAGQTLAIVDAYDHPSIAADLSVFDTQFGIAAPPAFIKVGLDASGTASNTTFPAFDSGWSEEIALDVEWAHVIAPAANLLLVEANSSSFGDLLAAVDYARGYTGQFGGSAVSVVSMSWGGGEFSGVTALDSHFTTPAGHQGVTFVASSGDYGAWYGVNWPASSPNVVAVGGTTLNVATPDGTYGSETGWSGSGGGYSNYEPEPSYQRTVQSSGVRTTPDIAYDANPNSGYYVYVSTSSPSGWYQFGGTSAGAPQVAGLVTLANQARAQASPPRGTLDGPSQVLPALYTMPATNFHDVTTGSNGYSTRTGYDLVTGRGSPRADLVIPALANTTVGTVTTVQTATVRPPTAPTSVPTSPTGNQVTPGPTGGFTAVPFAISLSTQATAALAFANLSPVPGARLVLPPPAAVSYSTVPLFAPPATRPAERWISVVGAEDPVVEERGDGAGGTGVRPAVGQPGNPAPAEMIPRPMQSLRLRIDGPMTPAPQASDEVSEGALAGEAGVTAQPASALAGLFVVLGSWWAFRPDDSEETRRARAKPHSRFGGADRN